MAIMRRDVNFGLFVLIIATLVVFAGFTSYYQGTFENLTGEYMGKLSELDKTTSSLQQEKTRLNQTSLQLQLKAERETTLNEKYEEMVKWKDREEEAKLEFQGLYTETQGLLGEAERLRDQYKSERDQYKSERDKFEGDWKTELGRRQQLETDLRKCEDELAAVS